MDFPRCSLPNFSDSFSEISPVSILSRNRFDESSDTPISSVEKIPNINTQEEQHQRKSTKERKGVKIMIMNCRGLKGTGKRKQMERTLKTHNPGILLGTESFLDNTFKNSEICPTEYTAIGNDRNSNGGGVFIAYREDLILTEKEIENQNVDTESLYANLQIVGMPAVCLCVIYRPPNSRLEYLEEIDKEISSLTHGKKSINCVWGGDLNLPSIVWGEVSIKEGPQYGMSLNRKALEMVDDHGLTQVVEIPSRGPNILDIVLCTSPDLIGSGIGYFFARCFTNDCSMFPEPS